MKPSQAITAILTAWRANLAVFLWGGPGVGKSEILRQAAARYVAEAPELARFAGVAPRDLVEDVRLGIRNPVSLLGLPTVDAESRSTYFTRPDIVPTEDGDRVAVFFDELNQAPPMTQGGAYGWILDRRQGEHAFPDRVRVAAAGNRKSDRGVFVDMPKPLGNRFLHVNVDFDLEDFLAIAAARRFRPEILAFGRWQPGLMYALPGEEIDVSGTRVKMSTEALAFPTSRSWEMLSKSMQAGIPSEIESEYIAGLIGDAVGSVFTGFLRTFRQLPNPAGVLLDPMSAPIPDNAGARWAIASALAGKVDVNTFGNAISYFGRFTDGHTGTVLKEYSIVFVRDAIRRNPKLQQTLEFNTWVSDNSEVIFS